MKLKVVNKARFITAVAILLFIYCAGLYALKPVKTLEYQVVENYTVQRGDTLWSICTEYRPTNMDIRDYIYEVEQFNSCTEDIHAGQVIQLIK